MITKHLTSVAQNWLARSQPTRATDAIDLVVTLMQGAQAVAAAGKGPAKKRAVIQVARNAIALMPLPPQERALADAFCSMLPVTIDMLVAVARGTKELGKRIEHVKCCPEPSSAAASSCCPLWPSASALSRRSR